MVVYRNVNTPGSSNLFTWPIDCIKGSTCQIKYPDINNDGLAFDCSNIISYKGHEGTDIDISQTQMDLGIPVFAAADGEVLWVFDGKYDKCPDSTQPDCQAPSRSLNPGENQGYQVCTDLGPYCKNGQGLCYWCFDGGNVVIIKHNNIPGIFATRYDHLKKNSILVRPGDHIVKGQKIGEVGSAGHSSNPHLHFEVWGNTYYDPIDPWKGNCNLISNSLFDNQP